MESSRQIATTTGANPQAVPGPPDLLTPLIRHFNETFSFGTGGLLDTLQTIWSIYTIVAYIAALVFLYIFIYASMRGSRLVAEQKELLVAQRDAYLKASGVAVKQEWWQQIQVHVDSTNPNDWKQAIIQADVILDDTLKRMGFSGTSLGERLRSISPQTVASVDEAWAAHKVRNQIAHGGVDFVLTQKLARDTIARYRIVFTELGILPG